MAGKDRSTKDKAMAAYLKESGIHAPSHWHGEGRDAVVMANKLGNNWKGRYSATFERGMVGGYLAEKLGYGKVEME